MSTPMLVRLSLRRLLARPALVVPAVAAIAVSGAALLLLLALVDGLLLKALPYPDAGQLYYLSWQLQPGEGWQRAMTEAQARIVVDHAKGFSAVGRYADAGTLVTLAADAGGGTASQAAAVRVDAGLLPTLGIAPAHGRGLSVDDVRDDAAVVVISAALAQQRLGGLDVVGQSLRIDGRAYQVVGVLPPSFRFYPAVDLLLPLPHGGVGADGSNTSVVARLAADMTPEAVRAQLVTLSRTIHAAGAGDPRFPSAAAVPLPLSDVVAGDSGRLLLPVTAAVSVLGLLGCINAATLLLGLGLAGRADAAVELALGASPALLWRRRICEATLVLGAGLAIALLFATAVLPALRALLPWQLPRLQDVALDYRTLLLALPVALLMWMLLAVLTTWGGRVQRLAGQLQQQGTRTGGSVGLQPWLVAVQVALSGALLAACALIGGSFSRLLHTDAGFRIAGLYAVELGLSDARYRDPQLASTRTDALLARLAERLADRPGVHAVASTSSLPLERGLNDWAEVPTTALADGASVNVRIVGGGYLSLLRVPMLAGQPLSGDEQAEGEPVVLVNAALARRLSADPAQAVGLTLRLEGVDWRISGVAADLSEDTLRRAPEPTVYLPRGQAPSALQAAVNRWFPSVLLVDADTPALADEMRSVLTGTDPDVALVSLRPLAHVVGASLALERFFAGVLAAFGLVALLLTAIGLLGVLGQLQWLRRREFAVRLAVGASARGNAGLLYRQAARWCTLGLLAALPLTLLAQRALAPWLFHAGFPGDLPWLLLGASALLLTIVIASLPPACRAARVQPTVVLHHD